MYNSLWLKKYFNVRVFNSYEGLEWAYRVEKNVEKEKNKVAKKINNRERIGGKK